MAAHGTAEDCYREALDRLSRTRLRPELARVHLLYGEWLRRENRRKDARIQLHIAREMLDTIGMRAFADRAHRELLATGETVRRRTVEPTSTLTAQEHAIAGLAVTGCTNVEIGAQLFLSARTSNGTCARCSPSSTSDLGVSCVGRCRHSGRSMPRRDP